MSRALRVVLAAAVAAGLAAALAALSQVPYTPEPGTEAAPEPFPLEDRIIRSQISHPFAARAAMWERGARLDRERSGQLAVTILRSKPGR